VIDDSLRSVLKKRMTVRKFVKSEFSAEQVKELVWAAYGHTHTMRDIKMRTAPSPGAKYATEIYVSLQSVSGYDDGIYRFDTAIDNLVPVKSGRFHDSISDAALEQKFFQVSNVNIFMIYNSGKIVPDYGANAAKYCAMECGHIGQNVLLMATSLGLGAVPVGAFDSSAINDILGLSEGLETVYIISIGAVA
jgi:SagB-type dehydrogenase family enzyme